MMFLVVTAAALIVVGFRLYTHQDTTTATLSPYGDVLIPNQDAFQAKEVNRRTVRWLSQRWGVSEQDIYMIVEDSEPWMQVAGLLDIQSLSSARVWVLDPVHREGQRWESELLRQGVPHEDNVYLVREYRPQAGSSQQQLAVLFYSRPTWDALAIIEDIRFSNGSDGSGSILAYQSQKHLPSITIPIADGIPQKDKGYQTPIMHD